MNSYFKTAVSMGFAAPATYEAAKKYITELRNNDERIKNQQQEDENIFIIPEGVVKIGDLCFNSCTDIEIIDFPSSIKEIGSMAFFKCESLKELKLPDGLEAIGSDAFTKCVSLDYIFIPSSVQAIGHHAFYDCSGVDQINLGHKDESSLSTGENWLPQKREIFMKDVPAVYGQERGE